MWDFPIFLWVFSGLCNTYGSWLVVWNMILIFAHIGNVIIPIDFHIFQRGRYTTNQITVEMENHILKSPSWEIYWKDMENVWEIW